MGESQDLSAPCHQRLTAMVSQVQSRFIRAAPTTEVFAPLLDDLLGFTQSEYGFIADVLTDRADGHRYLRMQVLTDISWNEDTRQMYQAHQRGERAIEFHNLDSLLGAAIVDGVPVIANDPAQHVRRGGLPQRHPALNSYVGVPLFHGGELIGLVGLSNRPGGYDNTLLDFLQPLFASVAAIIGATRSEAARLQAEAALRQSEFEMRCTFEMAAVGMAHLAMDSRFLRANRQLCLALGCDESALLGRSLFEVIQTDDHPVLIDHMAELITTRMPRAAQELRGVHVAGHELWLLFSATVIAQEAAGAAFIIAVLEDVTARKQHQARALAVEAAERAHAARTRFLSHVSHELRTPLNVVVGFSQLMQLDPGCALSDVQRQQARHIEAAGLQLLTTVNDMIDLSGIESGASPLHFESIDLRQAAEQAVSRHQRAAIEAGVRLEVLPPSSPGDEWACRADQARLQQVLSHWLTHAIRQRCAGHLGLIVRAGDRADTVELCLHIVDGAHSPEQLAQLFTPLIRLDAADDAVVGESGMGVRISHRLVQLMEGHIGERHDAHWGLGVALVLKAAENPSLPSAANSGHCDDQKPAVAALSALTLLYVDDKPMNVELLAGVLQMRPQWRMAAATNGRAAVAMASAQPLDLLLLELQLGDMSGLELLRRLRRIPRLSAVPCLMLSTDTATTARTSQDGVLGCWTKPLDVPRLLQLLDAVAQR